MIIATILFGLATFLFGYFLGKRLGYEDGIQEGRAIIPLLLRQQSYEQGYCSLCWQAKPQNGRAHRIKPFPPTDNNGVAGGFAGCCHENYVNKNEPG